MLWVETLLCGSWLCNKVPKSVGVFFPCQLFHVAAAIMSGATVVPPFGEAAVSPQTSGVCAGKQGDDARLI